MRSHGLDQSSLSAALDGQYTPLDDDTVAAWRAAGWWEGRTVRSLLTEAAQRHPDRVALVGRRSDGRREVRTYAQFDANAHHAGNVFAAMGVGAGDAVVLMLPNWIEYPEMVFGINEIGAIYSAIPVGYGERQAAAVLRRSKATVLVIPRRWRSTEHLELSRKLRQAVPTLRHVILLDDDASDLRDGVETLWSDHVAAAPHRRDAPDPNRVCYLGFTSGTTGEPKGAMHSHESLVYSARLQAEHVGPDLFGTPPVHLVASPVGHHTGFIWGIVFTVLLAGTGVHVDRWDPVWGVQIIREEGVTMFFGAPTFLQDMMRTDLAGSPNSLTCLVIAGAPVPRNLPAQAQKALGAYICPAWGMTECSIVTSCTPDQPEQIQLTDGSVFAGSEAKIVDATGAECPRGVVGDLLVRGPALFYGYFDRPEATRESFLPGLWFRTGDRASIDEHGWVSLTGRSKDIVIRGGENIPVTDIESLLFDHPDVANVAIIGVPDERLGERVCAVVTVKNGRPDLTVTALAEYLLEAGVSKHHLPERVVNLPQLPMTPSGKIQKFKLRDTL